MAASTEQKLDYLLKKIGYTASKTGLAEDSSLSGTKKAPFAEAIPSPLVTPSTTIWNESALIPTTPPGSDTGQVRVYLAGTSGHRMTVDSTVSGSRAFIAYSTYNDTSSGILGDWIDPQFGDAYIIKVYKGDPNSGGTLLSAAGAGSNDTWFFDYSSGVLNFNGTVIPSGVTDTNIYIVGYRYIGVKGLATSGIDTGGTSTFTNLDVTGVTTFTDNINPKGNIVGDNATNIIGIDNISASGISSASAFADFDYLQAPFGSTTTFTVTVSSKDATHRYNGQGSGNAYLINGVQSPILTLTPGRTYRFTNDNTGSHPLKFYYEADRTTLYTTGVNFQNTYTEITISDTTPNVLHYQCTNHGLMGNAIITNSNVIDSPYAATLRNSLTVTNNINANGNIIGDNATNISGINSISALGLHVDGDVSIGGTLTYEDVTNIDSVGLITAQTGVRITTGGLIINSGVSTLSHVSVNAGVVSFTNVSNPTPSDVLPTGTGGHIYSYDNGIRIVGGTGAIRFHSAGFQRWQIDTAGSFTPFTNNLVNIGGSSNRVRRFYGGNLDVSGVSTISNTVVGGATTELFVTGDARVTGELKVGDGTIILNDTGISTFPTGVNIGAVSISTVTESSFPFDVKVGSAITFFSGAGIVSATSYRGDGSKLTGIVTSTGINTEGTSTFQNITVSGNINANGNIVGDNSTNITGIAGVTATTLSGTLQTAAQPNVTSLGTLTGLTVSGISTLGVTSTTNLETQTLNVTGVSTFANNVQLKDNVSLKFGDNKQIIATPGDLEVEASGSEDITLTVNASGGTASDIRLKTGSTESVKVNGDGGVIVTGILTATDFSGNISGVGATFTNITGTLQTAAQPNITSVGTLGALTVSGNINANGNIVGDNSTNITGIAGVTATTLSGTLQTAAQPNITSVGTLSSLNVTGDVSIGGTLTYEDVTNIDSVGLITARSGIFLPDNQKVQFGNAAGSADLEIYHTGNESVIKQTGTGDLIIDALVSGADIRLRSAAEFVAQVGGATHIQAYASGGTALFQSGSKKLETLSNGARVTGTLDVTDGITVAGNIDANGNIVGDSATNISGINSVTATTFYGNGANLTGIDKIQEGDTKAEVVDDGTIADFIVTNENVERFRITKEGRVGIGTTNPIATPTSILDVRGDVNVGTAITMYASSGIVSATKFFGDGSGLENVGVDTGTISADSIDTGTLNVTGVSTLSHVSVNSGVVTFTNVSNPTPSNTLPTGTGGHIYSYDNGIRIVGAIGGIRFSSAGFERWRIDSSGNFKPSSTDGYNIGSDTYPVKNLIVSGNAGIGSVNVSGVSTFSDDITFTTASGNNIVFDKSDNQLEFGNDVKAEFGASGQLEVNFESNSGNSVIKHTSNLGSLVLHSDNLDLRPKTNVGAVYLRANYNDGVDLYFANSKKFETTNTGVTVTGNITGTGDLTLTDTATDSAAGPEFKLFRNSASPADADYLGQIKFAGESDTGVERNYAKITGKILDASNGTEDGIIEFAHIKAGSQNISARFRSDSLQLLNDTNLSVAGDTTLTGGLDVDGHTELDNLRVSGISTFNDHATFNRHILVPDGTQDGSSGGSIRIGDSQDMQIFHSAGNGQIRNNNGSLVIRGSSTNNSSIKFENTAGEVYANMAANGSVDLYFNGSKKFETTNTGAVVTGILTATSFSGDGSNLSNVGFTTSVGTFNASSGVATIDSFAHATEDYKVAEYTLHFTNGSDIQAQKLLVMQDGSTAYSQEFAVMSSGSQLVSLDAIISGANVLVRATPETGVSGTTTFRWRRIVQE